MKPSEILDNAADIILRDGWLQGMYYQEPKNEVLPWGDQAAMDEMSWAANRSSPCCQAGAIARAAFGYAWPNAGAPDLLAKREGPEGVMLNHAWSKADSYMRKYVQGNFSCNSAIEWNDRSGVTKEKVVEALRGAADVARGVGE